MSRVACRASQIVMSRVTRRVSQVVKSPVNILIRCRDLLPTATKLTVKRVRILECCLKRQPNKNKHRELTPLTFIVLGDKVGFFHNCRFGTHSVKQKSYELP